LKAFLLALGDDVQMKELEKYIAFRRLKNFVCVKVRSRDVQVWARLDPSSVPLEEGFTRDVSQVGHAGTGDLGNPDTDGCRSGASPASPAAKLLLAPSLQWRERLYYSARPSE
jgi:predicted transport protein